jgi:hypothetical protein
MLCELWVLLAELWHEECLLILGDATHHIGINYTLQQSKSNAEWQQWSQVQDGDVAQKE